MGRPFGFICALTVVLLAAACSTPEIEQAAEGQGGVAVPESAYPPHIQCHLDRGWTLESVDGDGGFELSISADLYSDEERQRIAAECRELAPEVPERTDEEVREIYERWLVEADCLRDLGYEPDLAPPFEVFLADWRGRGPWSPIHGVETSSWTREIYEEAKAACGLDHFGMGF